MNAEQLEARVDALERIVATLCIAAMDPDGERPEDPSPAVIKMMWLKYGLRGRVGDAVAAETTTWLAEKAFRDATRPDTTRQDTTRLDET